MSWLKRMPSRADRAIVWAIVATALLLPWVVAIGVKLYLDVWGVETVPWPEIAALARDHGARATLIAAAPLVVLAIVYRQWSVGGFGRFLRATPRQGRVVVLFGFAGGVAGMMRVFLELFYVFDPAVLGSMPSVAARYLPWLAGGLVVGMFVARPATGAWAPENAPRRPVEGRRDPELAREAVARARSLGIAVGVAVPVGVVELGAALAAPGSLVARLLLGLATICFLWASWAILRGAWLLGTRWVVAFVVCWFLGLAVFVLGLVVFLKLRRIGGAGGCRTVRGPGDGPAGGGCALSRRRPDHRAAPSGGADTSRSGGIAPAPRRSAATSG